MASWALALISGGVLSLFFTMNAHSEFFDRRGVLIGHGLYMSALFHDAQQWIADGMVAPPYAVAEFVLYGLIFAFVLGGLIQKHNRVIIRRLAHTFAMPTVLLLLFHQQDYTRTADIGEAVVAVAGLGLIIYSAIKYRGTH